MAERSFQREKIKLRAPSLLTRPHYNHNIINLRLYIASFNHTYPLFTESNSTTNVPRSVKAHERLYLEARSNTTPIPDPVNIHTKCPPSLTIKA